MCVYYCILYTLFPQMETIHEGLSHGATGLMGDDLGLGEGVSLEAVVVVFGAGAQCGWCVACRDACT
jgi:hypothetical protein